MRVVIFMDDVDSPDVTAFTRKELAREMEAEMTSFSEALGR